MSRGSPGSVTRTRRPGVTHTPHGSFGTPPGPSTPVSTVASWGLGLASLYPGTRVARLGWGLGGRLLGSQFVRKHLVKNTIRLYKWGLQPLVAFYGYKQKYRVIGPEYKYGFRYGLTGEVTTLGDHPILHQYAVPTTEGLPAPLFGAGLTVVPASEPRIQKWTGLGDLTPSGSRGGLSVQSSQHRGQHKRWQSTTTPSAHSEMDGLSSAKRDFGGGTRGSRPRRRGSRSRHTRTTHLTPTCPVHHTRHWCNVTRSIRRSR